MQNYIVPISVFLFKKINCSCTFEQPHCSDCSFIYMLKTTTTDESQVQLKLIKCFSKHNVCIIQINKTIDAQFNRKGVRGYYFTSNKTHAVIYTHLLFVILVCIVLSIISIDSIFTSFSAFLSQPQSKGSQCQIIFKYRSICFKK